jgi:hypothetical protein
MAKKQDVKEVEHQQDQNQAPAPATSQAMAQTVSSDEGPMRAEDSFEQDGVDVSKIPPEIKEPYFSTPEPGLDEDAELEDTLDEENGDSDSTDTDSVSLSKASAKEVVQEINRIAQRTVEQGKLEIGDYLLRILFNGDIEQVLDRSPYKSKSLKEVCQDPELLVDRRKLGAWIRAAALRVELEQSGVNISQLTFSHFLALLRAGKGENGDNRLNLAKEIIEEDLSVRQIINRVEEQKNKLDPAAKKKEIMKKLEAPLSLLSDEDSQELISDRDRLENELDTNERFQMLKQIDKSAKEMDECKKLLKQLKSNLVGIELSNLDESDD